MSGIGQQHKMAGLDETDQNINQTPEDISKQAQGHKANLSNPSMKIFFYLYIEAEERES